jgi:hypothetical protein
MNANGDCRCRAAAPGRPKQGPTLLEGRSTYPSIGVLTMNAAAPGCPKQRPTLLEGRSMYPSIGVLT